MGGAQNDYIDVIILSPTHVASGTSQRYNGTSQVKATPTDMCDMYVGRTVALTETTTLEKERTDTIA